MIAAYSREQIVQRFNFLAASNDTVKMPLARAGQTQPVLRKQLPDIVLAKEQ
jgi:hypothetical protein